MIASFLKVASCSKEGRASEFERLMRETSRQAYNLAIRLTGNTTEAEDLVQETYVRAYRFFSRYDANLPFAGWLYRIMTNVHIDNVRRKSKVRTVSIEQPTPDGARTWDLPDDQASADRDLLESTLAEPLQRGLQVMNPEFRTAVLLADVEGLSYEEVADIMQTSVGTVRSRIHRGRRQLRDFLQQGRTDVGEVSLS